MCCWMNGRFDDVSRSDVRKALGRRRMVLCGELLGLIAVGRGPYRGNYETNEGEF